MSTNQSQKNQSQKSQTQDQSAQAPLLSQQTLGQLIPDFQDRQVTTALRKLIGFSLAIIGLPLSSMFIAKIWLFEGVLNYTAQDSILYAAILAVVLVHIVLVAFVYAAYSEDKRPVAATPKKQD